jgi:hypothetical protein
VLVGQFQNKILDIFEQRESVFIYIKGRRGSGKTDIGLYITETLNDCSDIKYFATNIKIYESDFPIEPIDNLDDLRLWAYGNQGRKLYILDEAGKVYRRRTPLSRVNVDFLDDFQTLRKPKLSFIQIAPADKFLDSASLGSDMLDLILTKPTAKNKSLVIYDDQLEDDYHKFSNIPPTRIKFDTHDSALFTRHSKIQTPQFKDKDLQYLWEWAINNKTCKDLGLHSMQINRLSKKFIKEVLERDYHSSQKKALEDTMLGSIVTP